LKNLVNCAQAIPEGNATQHTVRVRSFRDGDRVHVEVKDTGCGIAPEVRAHIFDPFFSTKPVGTGMGLGLSICHGIVQSFGGEIGVVETEVGVGTTFRVSLRVAWPSEEISMVTPAPVVVPPAVSAPRRARVLVVDDEVHVLYALNRLLRRDHDVTLAVGGYEALQKIEHERYDVILCDLMMPEMSGMDLFGAVKEVAAEQAERFVFMTGGAFTPRAQEFLAAIGDARTLEKPVRKEELLGRIRDIGG
jgi:CheY-like chemotaxis protein